MKLLCGMTAFAAIAVAAGVSRGDETPIAVSEGLEFAIETMQEASPSPRFIKTAAELTEITGGTWKFGWGKGDIVQIGKPDGSALPLADGTAAGSAALAVDMGGCWTAKSAFYGDVAFYIRNSLCGTLGDGTEASPAKLVDAQELIDYNAPAGYVFTLNGVDSLLSDIETPAGLKLVDDGSGVYRLASAPDGCLYSWAELEFPVDSVRDGPDRTAGKRDVLPIAYSGDDWAMDVSAAATVTFTSPTGESSVLDLSGTGSTRFVFNKSGLWTVSLEMVDGTTRVAHLDLEQAGFVLSFR